MGPRRALPVFALAACFALAVTACAPSPAPMSYDQAATHYDATMTDVVGALASAYPQVTWSTDAQTGASTATGECRLHVATREGEPSLVQSAGGWDAVWVTVNPVLEDNGFAVVGSQDDVPGGWTASSSRDDRGAVLQLSDKGKTVIILSAPLDDDDCPAAS